MSTVHQTKTNILWYLYVGVSINGGTPKCMVMMEYPIKMDDLGVCTPTLGNPHVFVGCGSNHSSSRNFCSRLLDLLLCEALLQLGQGRSWELNPGNVHGELWSEPRFLLEYVAVCIFVGK